MISDFAARQAALDPHQSFIVQAPAGSGKTGLLVYRMLTLLAAVEAPGQVLAITFTRKATAEMRERLVELLSFAEHNHRSDDAFEQQGIDLAHAVLLQDQQHNWRLLDAPHQLQILTIDAFCAKLTSSMPWLSRLGDRPQTTDQAELHYAAAIEQMLNELLDDHSVLMPFLQTVMLELDFNYNKARSLFASMLAKRDQWLRHLVQGDLSAMRERLEQAWQAVVGEQTKNLSSLLPQTTLDELVGLAVYAAPNFLNKHGHAGALAPFLEFDSNQLLQAEHWQALANMLLTGNALRKKVNIIQGFEAKTPPTIRMHELLAEFADDVNLLNALIDTRELPETRFSDGDWQHLMALEKVLKSLAAFLQLRFRATGECDHSEVTQRANLALQELERPTDLGLRLDHHLQHILVDEFQDTSHGQIELLKKLTLGWDTQPDHEAGAGAANTLFLVGDPMQSIYRFREADVSLFLQVADNASTQIFPNLSIVSLKLTENFRSSNSLVTWFNTTFASSFPLRDDVLSGAIQYAQASCSKTDSQTACDYLLAQDKNHEAQLLLAAVESALAALPSNKDKIAILVRARSQLETLLPLLDRAGICYTGLDIQPLREQQAVIDALVLCKAICRLDDRVSWLSLLRGPWCGLTLSEIKQLVGNQEQTVWSQLQGSPELLESVESQQRLMRFIRLMQQAIKQRQKVSLASLTRWTWIALGGDDALFGANRDDVETVFQLIEKLERGGDLESMRELDKALSGLFAQPRTYAIGQEPQVVVSTMHKAKGLQYHTVILPSLASSSASNDKEVLMWAEAQTKHGGSSLLLAPLSNQTDSRHYQYLRYLDAKRATNEAVRLMYVAATRAEQKLVLLARAKVSDKTGEIIKPVRGSLLATVWDALADNFSFENTDVVELDEHENLPNVLQRLPPDYVRSFPNPIIWEVKEQLNSAPQVPEQEESKEYDWATSVAKGVGIVLHQWLQYIGSRVLMAQITPKLEHRWRAELLALRVSTQQVDYALQRLTTAVANIQSHAQAHFLFEDYEEQHNEYALSALDGDRVKTYRIDRTFIDTQGQRWIVDYKSTPHDQGDVSAFAREQVETRHKRQLNKYGDLFQQLDARPIKLAVYFPLLKELVSWTYQSDDKV